MSKIDIIVVVAYFVALLVIIVFSKKPKSMSDFAIDGQRAAGPIIFATLCASFIGPGYTLGIAEKGFSTGFLYLFVYLGFSIQMILVGIFIAPRLRKYMGAFTVGDIMGYHYGKASRFFTGILSMLFCAGIVGVVARASGVILKNAIGLPFLWGVILSALVVVVYSSIGGMRTVIHSDVFQFVMLGIALPALVISIFIKGPGIGEIISKLPQEFYKPLHEAGFLTFLGLFIGFLLGETLVPPYTNRAFVAKNLKNAKNGFMASGVFSIFWFSMALAVGLVGKALAPHIAAENSFMHMAIRFLPVGLLGLMAAALFSIIMSTQDSFLNAAAVSFVRDIFGSFSKNTATDKKALNLSKISTACIGLLGIIFAIYSPGIVEAILICYTLWAPTVVLPLILGVLLKDRVKPLSGLVAIIAGGIATAVWEWGFGTPYGIPSLLVGVLFNQMGFWLTHLLVRKDTTHSWLTPSSGCTGIVD
jgi:SSS family solute:Na+ symporter